MAKRHGRRAVGAQIAVEGRVRFGDLDVPKRITRSEDTLGLMMREEKEAVTIKEYLDTRPIIAGTAYVDPSAVIIGDVTIGKDSSIWPLCSIRGDVNAVKIGDCTNIQDGSVLHVTHKYPDLPNGYPLTIGSSVTVGHRVILHGCTIADQVLIGMGSIIMDDVCVGKQVLIGAGSIVTQGKQIESGYLWYGAPARKIRPLTQQEKQWIVYSAEHYVRLKNNYN